VRKQEALRRSIEGGVVPPPGGVTPVITRDRTAPVQPPEPPAPGSGTPAPAGHEVTGNQPTGPQ
jgi:hypothetical protein